MKQNESIGSKVFDTQEVDAKNRGLTEEDSLVFVIYFLSYRIQSQKLLIAANYLRSTRYRVLHLLEVQMTNFRSFLSALPLVLLPLSNSPSNRLYRKKPPAVFSTTESWCDRNMSPSSIGMTCQSAVWSHRSNIRCSAVLPV